MNMHWTKTKLSLTAAATVMMIGVAGCGNQNNPPSPYGGGSQYTATPENTTTPESTNGGMGVSGMALPGGLSGLASQTKEHAVNSLNSSVDNLQNQFDQLKDRAQNQGFASSAVWKEQATKFTSSIAKAKDQIQSLSGASAQQWKQIVPQAKQSVTDAGAALKSLAGMVQQTGQNMIGGAATGAGAAAGGAAQNGANAAGANETGTNGAGAAQQNGAAGSSTQTEQAPAQNSLPETPSTEGNQMGQ